MEDSGSSEVEGWVRGRRRGKPFPATLAPGLPGTSPAAEPGGATSFTDGQAIPALYRASVGALQSAGVMRGYPGGVSSPRPVAGSGRGGRDRRADRVAAGRAPPGGEEPFAVREVSASEWSEPPFFGVPPPAAPAGPSSGSRRSGFRGHSVPRYVARGGEAGLEAKHGGKLRSRAEAVAAGHRFAASHQDHTRHHPAGSERVCRPPGAGHGPVHAPGAADGLAPGGQMGHGSEESGFRDHDAHRATGDALLERGRGSPFHALCWGPYPLLDGVSARVGHGAAVEDVDLDKGMLQVKHSLSWPRGGKPDLLPPKWRRGGASFPSTVGPWRR